jgi:hypothetical protein
MCISCGCGFLHDKHNNPNNITLDDLEKAAKAANQSVEDAAKNIADAVGLRCDKL